MYTQLVRPVDTKEVNRLREEWSITIQSGKILENTKTGQWKIIGLLALNPIETLGDEGGQQIKILCGRCGAYLQGFRKTTPTEEAAFNLERVPDYAGGWLVAPLKVEGKVVTRAYRCSCPVGRSLPVRAGLYDNLVGTSAKTTQEELTRLTWQLQEQDEAKVMQGATQSEGERLNEA